MSQTWYDGYKDVTKKYDYSYKGYNLKQLVPGYLSLDLFAVPKTRDLLKRFYLSTKILDVRSLFETQESTLITYLIHRTDYAELANATKQNYDSASVIDLSELPTKNISMCSFLFIKHLWLACWIVFSRSIGFNFRYKLHFVALTIMLLNEIAEIEKIKQSSKIKRYICFNSAFKEESLLTLYFKKQKVPTMSIQHGIFCDFKLFIPFDIINMENCLSDQLLCWGQSTIDYLSAHGFDQSRFVLTGNPKYKGVKDIESIDQSFDRCLVLLGRETYTETNNKLLTLLKKYNDTSDRKILFYIKKHPFLSDDVHKEHSNIESNLIFLGKEHSVREVLKSDLVNFCIAVNTTAYYEALTLGKPCLRWVEEENEQYYGMEDKFETLEEMEKKITSFKNMDSDKLKREMLEVITFVFKPE